MTPKAATSISQEEAASLQHSRIKSLLGQINSLEEEKRHLIEQNTLLEGRLKTCRDLAVRRQVEMAYALLKEIIPDLPKKYPGREVVAHILRGLVKDAHTDDLMGIGNRRSFRKNFPKYFERLERGETTDISLLFADVDDFRDYNKKKGHRKGDAILTGVGTVATTTFPKSLIAKYGGEEIAVVDEESLESAYRSAERFRLNIENSRFGVLEESDKPVTITIGVATYERGMTPGDLIDRADEAMQHAKRAGKNRVFFYDPKSKLYVPYHKE